LITSEHRPTAIGYSLFFAFLFAFRRWWKQADAFRPKLFRVSTLLVTGVVGTVISILWAFPQPWALSWAATISCVVQLSAVWISPEDRLVWSNPAPAEATAHAFH